MKKVISFFPEVLVLLLSIYWFIDNFLPNHFVNFISLAAIIVMVFQLKFQFKFIGVVLATSICFFSLYMVFAVFSEFNDFKVINSEAVQLLIIGLLLFGLSFISGLAMYYKYLIYDKKLSI